MPQFAILIIFVILLAIVAYLLGGMRPSVGVLGAGLFLVLVVVTTGLL